MGGGEVVGGGDEGPSRDGCEGAVGWDEREGGGWSGLMSDLGGVDVGGVD